MSRTCVMALLVALSGCGSRSDLDDAGGVASSSSGGVEPDRGVIVGPPGSEVGDRIAFVGDLDGDGLGDLVVADRELSDPAIEAGGGDGSNATAGRGAVYVFYGRTTWTGNERVDAVRLLLDRSCNGRAITVAGAGDVDGDGLADFVVGRQSHDAGDPDSLYIVFGSGTRYPARSGIDEHALVLDGRLCDGAIDTIGVGDLDADGHADIAVPCLDDGDGAGFRIVYGSSALAVGTSPMDAVTTAQITHAGGASPLYPGAVGDYDGDGYADIAAGGVFLLRGGPTPLSGAGTIDETSRIVSDGTVVTRSAPAIGDGNGDGRDDLLIYDGQALRLFRGQAIPAARSLAEADAVLWSSGDGSSFSIGGGERAVLGETGHLVIGEPSVSLHGAAFLLPMPAIDGDVPLDAHLSYGGQEPTEGTIDRAGETVALGDLDGDGMADLVYGAPGNSTGGNGASSRLYFVRSAQLLSDL